MRIESDTLISTNRDKGTILAVVHSIVNATQDTVDQRSVSALFSFLCHGCASHAMIHRR